MAAAFAGPRRPGIGPKTAASLLADGWHHDDLPGTPRLHGHRARATVDQWDHLRLWRDLIRLDTAIAPPTDWLTGQATPPMPPAGRLLDAADLW